ncbi:serine hydrolase domain-containing protein [Lysinimonas soli]|uniref:Serine hydrolase domain-containing protein n=1 Tax=Lysinimonas soli TaxID=1074233 RepID=A0ABW0NRX7_9MICO
MTEQRFVPERLARLHEVIEADVETGLYHGASIKITRNGELGFDEAVGFADKARTRPLTTDSVFSIFSGTKAFINVLVLRAIERGQFALTTKMVDIIPEFAGAPRDRSTVFNFLTHTTGMPGVWEPKAGPDYDTLASSVAAVCEYVLGVVEPGTRCDYSPMANHTLLAEALRRTDPAGRDILTILNEDLFDPLGMVDTAFGISDRVRPRHVVPDTRGIIPIKVTSSENDDDFGLFTATRNEATWVGASSTTSDLTRFLQMLRNGGSLGTARILSPRTVEMARKNWTGELPNELYRTVALRNGYAPPPAYLGLGFNVRGTAIVNHQLGTLTSPETFGNYGAGSVVFWVDPALDVTLVVLTAGLLDQARNIERFQRISDLVVAAAR